MLLIKTPSTLKALGGFQKCGMHRNIPICDTFSYLGPSIYDITNFPCHQKVRHNITLTWMWQEYSLGNTPRFTDKDSLTNEPFRFTLGYIDVQKLERFVVIMSVFWLKSIMPGMVFYKW